MAAVGRVLHGVAEHVEHDLLDAPAVAHDHGEIMVVVRQLVAVAARLQLDGAQHGVDGRAEVEARHVHLASPAVEPREREQVLHDVGHAVGLVDDDVEEAVFQLARQLVARVADGLGVGADIRERGAQLVGDVRHELAAALLGLALLRDVMEHDEHAAALFIGKGREVQLDRALADRQLGGDKVAALHGHHLFKGAQRLEEVGVDALVRAALQKLARGGVAVDERAVAVVGDHAVCHVEKERVELVALVLHRLERGVQHACHVVERGGEDADLVGGVDLELFAEVAACHALGALGQLFDGIDHRFAQQEAQQHGDQKTHEQRLQNDDEQLAVEAGDRAAVVADVDDIAVVAAGDGDGNVHVAGRDVALVADLSVAGGEEIRGLLELFAAELVARGEAFAARGVENVVVAAARVDAERTGIGLEHGLHDRHAALLRGLGAQGVDEVGVALAEGLAHLRVEVVNVEVGHAGHQERAHHRHERGDEQQHDEH